MPCRLEAEQWLEPNACRLGFYETAKGQDVTAGRLVICRFCQQTYFAGPDERCSLCGKTGGLCESQAIELPILDLNRGSWADSKGMGHSSVLLAGCCGVLAGAFVGVLIVSSIQFGEKLAPVEANQVANAQGGECGMWAIPKVIEMFSRLILGGFIGAVGGAIVSTLLLLLLARPGNRNQTGSG
jgi:hypothetical protein